MLAVSMHATAARLEISAFHCRKCIVLQIARRYLRSAHAAFQSQPVIIATIAVLSKLKLPHDIAKQQHARCGHLLILSLSMLPLKTLALCVHDGRNCQSQVVISVTADKSKFNCTLTLQQDTQYVVECM